MYIFWFLLDFLFSSHHWWIGDILFLALYNYSVLFNTVIHIHSCRKNHFIFYWMCIKSSFVGKKNLLSCAVQFWSIKLEWRTNVTIMCLNDELSSMMSWVGCLQKYLELFILFAENNQIFLKISVFFHSVNFHLSGST